MDLRRRIGRHAAARGAAAWLDRVLSVGADPADAVLLTGFWRSGTTYLLEIVGGLLRARTFFEPFRPGRGARPPSLPGFEVEIRGRAEREWYPYVSPEAGTSPCDAFFRSVLTGRVSTPWTRRSRGLGNFLAARTVVKLVRGNLAAAYLQRRFGGPAVFLARHPCAVVASVERGGGGILEITSSRAFLEHLTSDAALVRDHLEPRLEAIGRWADSPLRRVALSWAILNWVPLRQRAAGTFDPLAMSYESLVLDSQNEIPRLARYLGARRPPQAGQLERDSSTTRRGRRGLDAAERVFGWRERMPTSVVRDVYGIVEAFGEPLTGLVAAIDARRSEPASTRPGEGAAERPAGGRGAPRRACR